MDSDCASAGSKIVLKNSGGAGDPLASKNSWKSMELKQPEMNQFEKAERMNEQVDHEEGIYKFQNDGHRTNGNENLISNQTVLSNEHSQEKKKQICEGNDEQACLQRYSKPSQIIRSWKRAIKPWSHFFSLSNFSLPTIDEYLKRFKNNLRFFIMNYAIITIIFVTCSIMTSFWLLLATIVLGLLIYLIYSSTSKEPAKIGGEEIPSSILYAIAVFVTMPLFVFAHIGYIVYCAADVVRCGLWRQRIIIYSHLKMIGISLFTKAQQTRSSKIDSTMNMVGISMIIVGTHASFFGPTSNVKEIEAQPRNMASIAIIVTEDTNSEPSMKEETSAINHVRFEDYH